MPTSIRSFSNAYAQNAPGIARLDAALIAELLPELTRAEARAAGSRAREETRQLNRGFPAFREALREHGPEQEQLLQGVLGQASSLGPSAIETELSSQALTGLQLQGQLSPADERASQQAARGGFAARGLLNSSPAAFAEVLNRQQFADARLNQRQSFAQAIDAGTNAREGAERGFGLQALSEVNRNFDPFRRFFEAPSRAGGSLSPTTLAIPQNASNLVQGSFALAAQRNLSDQQLAFQREQLANTNRQAGLDREARVDFQGTDLAFQQQRLDQEVQLALQTLSGNRRAGLTSGLLSAGGQIGGALVGGLIAF